MTISQWFRRRQKIIWESSQIFTLFADQCENKTGRGEQGGEEEVERERKDLKSVPNIDLPINGKFTVISQLRPSQNFKMRESLSATGGGMKIYQ